MLLILLLTLSTVLKINVINYYHFNVINYSHSLLKVILRLFVSVTFLIRRMENKFL